MTLEQRLAVLQAAIVRANIRAIAMQAENIQRVHRGESIVYDEHAFESLIEEERLDYNAVMSQVQS